MASFSRDQVLSLLAAANNHGDLAVKVSSLRQVRDILLAVDASFASEIFPYLVELQFSPQGLVKKSLLEIVEEVGLRALKHSPILMPMLLAFLRDTDQIVVAQSIVSGMKFFCSVLEEIALQMRRRGKIERWLEDLWMWMVKFKDVVFVIALEPGAVSTRLVALKFLETFVLLFSPNNDDYGKPISEGSRQVFNVSWLVGGYTFLDPALYMTEAKRILGTLFDLLRAANNHPGSVVITVITCEQTEFCSLFYNYNSEGSLELGTGSTTSTASASHYCSMLTCYVFEELIASGTTALVSNVEGLAEAILPICTMEHLMEMIGIVKLLVECSSKDCKLLAAIARKRTQHFSVILSTMLDFNVMNYERVKGFHAFSVQYSLRSAFLGFLRCTYPPIMESRERLVRVLRAMNAGDAVDQVLRQVDKLIRNAERASRDARLMKNDQPPNDMYFGGDVNRKRSISQVDEDSVHQQNAKRSNYGSDPNSVLQVQSTDSGNGSAFVEDAPPNGPGLVGELTPAEQMIAMIGALLAEGERGAESLEILVSKMHPDMLADIVITNMKHLPKIPPPLTKFGSSQMTPQTTSPSQGNAMTGPINSVPPVSIPQLPHHPVSAMNSVLPDSSSGSSFLIESKRDPRRDPRRQDPRLAVPVEAPPPPPPVQETASLRSELEASIFSKPPSPVVPVTGRSFSPPSIMINKNDEEMEEHALKDEPIHEMVSMKDFKDIAPAAEVNVFPEFAISPKQIDGVISSAVKEEVNETDESEPEDEMPLETNHQSFTGADSNVLEDSGRDLPSVPSYVELTAEQKSTVQKMSFTRIIESYKKLTAKEYTEMGMELIARLVAQVNADHDLVGVLQKHILEDYQSQKGHELVVHILYHLHVLAAEDSVGSSGDGAHTYERFLFSVAKSLLDHFPASDKSFSRLLGEAPILPDSLLKLMGDLCCSNVIDQCGKPLRDPDRVTQGLGSVWSLILGRTQYRQSCLDIALMCAVHSQDDIRAKSIRLVANKLYQLSYISENIEQFATNMLLSTINPSASDVELSEHCLQEQPGAEDTNDKKPVSRLEVSKPVTSDSESAKDSALSVPEAQRVTSLFFALCTKKPKLLHLVFDVYDQAPNTVKQAIHRQMPVLIRALGSSFSELLHIISDPPKGSENLLTLVLHILTEETTPSPDLIATVKHLYETKLKDVSILIPVLSLFTKNEVLPIFPRLLDLPPEKFQKGLAYILQGSAHTGPALTPAEVLVAIHDIVPEKDGLPLKKVMDACSACFEQRTVFTQQVLAKALNQMVDQSPVPLLFMRTVIQAIDAFPALVDFVMEILSKLVSRQVWKMPKLWVGFLKCVSQTQPHSFRVLLQLPAQQLEISLNKYPNLRAPLSAFASQPTVGPTLSRSLLQVLGLPIEPSPPQQPHPSSSSLHSVT